MSEGNKLNDILNYIDIGITNNNHKDHYILYITIIHNFFLNFNGIHFGIRYEILKQANLMLYKLSDHENIELKEEWIRLRDIIVPDLIKEDKEICDDDRYFTSS